MIKNILKNKIDLSLRYKGKIVNNKIEDYEIISYDLVSNSSFPINFDDTNDLQLQLLKELKRQELIEERNKKIKKINDTRRKI